MPTSTEQARLAPEERQKLLLDAANRYMQGEITVEEFERTEQRYRPNYPAVMRTLVRTQEAFSSVFALMKLITAVVSMTTRMTTRLLR
jgi:hypothetical protein